jgi:hypothetical protein
MNVAIRGTPSFMLNFNEYWPSDAIFTARNSSSQGQNVLRVSTVVAIRRSAPPVTGRKLKAARLAVACGRG